MQKATGATYNPLDKGGRRLMYTEVESQVKFLQGKILTIVEASYHEGAQLNAIKSLVKIAFSEQLTWIMQICYPDLPLQTREQVAASGVDVDAIESGPKKL